MTSRKIRGITDVAERGLCLGCGACAYMQPETITMVDDVDQGRRPLVLLPMAGGQAPDTGEALAVCPGVELAHGPKAGDAVIPELYEGWGPVLEVWEGHAADAAVRLRGSSGGVATALAAFCLEQHGMHGVLHIRARADIPYLNETVLSTTAEDLLAAAGSRYAPASPCDRLDLIESAPGPCVFIGKPCDVGAVAKARPLRPALDDQLGLTIGIFCAGTPSTRGTLEMLRVMGMDPAEVASVRYRGNGWPGNAHATGTVDGKLQERLLTYEESWGDILQKHRQWRCRVCADHTGEFADVAVGDPWYRKVQPGEPGESLVLVRTECGREVLHGAMAAGRVILRPAEPWKLPASQRNLLRTRGEVWGRIGASRAAGVPAPTFRNMPMAGIWWRELTPREKFRSVFGTLKRIRERGLRRRRPVRPWEPGMKAAVTGGGPGEDSAGT